MKRKRKIILALILLGLFLFIMGLVLFNKTSRVDERVYDLIKPFISNSNTSLFKIISILGSAIFIITVIVFYLILGHDKKMGIYFALAMIFSTIVNNVVKLIIARPRPVNVLVLAHENTFSFPSGHTMAITSLTWFIIYILNKYEKKGRGVVVFKTILLLIPLLVMVSRIYLGAHYFSDVLAGYFLATSIIFLYTTYLDLKVMPDKPNKPKL